MVPSTVSSHGPSCIVANTGCNSLEFTLEFANTQRTER